MVMEMKDIYTISEELEIPGEIIGVKALSNGHINTTLKIDVSNEGKIKSYILQKINTNVFKKPDELMQNILSVTEFIKEHSGKKSRKSLKFLKGKNGKGYVQIDDDYYRAYEYVNNSETYDITENLDIIYETGLAFGEFQTQLRHFDSTKLFETIPNFHNTPKRFFDLQLAISNDVMGRYEGVRNLADQYLSLYEPAVEMYNQYLSGALPSRVTHNDTKCNNVLFDINTKKHICVIDLDTVMPGLAGFDFGDGIRFIASTATEDERDLSKVSLDLSKFESFTKGFLDGCAATLTEHEIETLPLGAITMTAECGSRFLADYLSGDTYFKINYPEHNLDRARCQLKLAQDMLDKYSKMQEIVSTCSKQKFSESNE